MPPDDQSQYYEAEEKSLTAGNSQQSKVHLAAALHAVGLAAEQISATSYASEADDTSDSEYEPGTLHAASDAKAQRGGKHSTFFGVSMNSPDCSPLKAGPSHNILRDPLPSASPDINPIPTLGPAASPHATTAQLAATAPGHDSAPSAADHTTDSLAYSLIYEPPAAHATATAAQGLSSSSSPGLAALEKEHSQLSAEASERHLQQLHHEMQKLRSLQLELQQQQRSAFGSPSSIRQSSAHQSIVSLSAGLATQSMDGSVVQRAARQLEVQELATALAAARAVQQTAQQEAEAERALRQQCDVKLQQKQQEIIELKAKMLTLQQQVPRGKVSMC